MKSASGGAVFSGLSPIGEMRLISCSGSERRQRGHNRPGHIDLGAWRHEVEKAKWPKRMEIKAIYGTADVIGDNRIVFDICGNSYRLVVKFNHVVGVARILFAGTHPEYDAIDALTVAEDDNDETDQDQDRTQSRS